MIITLAMVASLNGKITNGELSPSVWASKEDQNFFIRLKKEHNLIVMGRNTYDAARAVIVPDPDALRVVLTSNPKQFHDQKIPGQLEFWNASPRDLVTTLQDRGYTKMLLVGGTQVATAFFTEHLINELYLTLEPTLFGTGTPLVGEGIPIVLLTLKEVTQLNPRGTVLLHYIVSS